MRLIISLLLLLLGHSLCAQMYHTNGRQVCCGDSLLLGTSRSMSINPSFLGRTDRKQFSLDLLHVGGSFYGPQLSLGELTDFSVTDMEIDSNLRTELINRLSANSDFTYTGVFEINWLDFSFTSATFGGIAFGIRDRVNTSSDVNDKLFQLLLQGKEAPIYKENGAAGLYDAGDGTRIRFSHVREASLGYSRRVFASDDLEVAIGASLKYLWAIGYFNARVEGEQLIGQTSFSEFYDQIDYENVMQGAEDVPRRLFGNAGGGFGADLGLSVSKPGVYSLGLSVLDLGGINWNEKAQSVDKSIRPFIDSLDSGLIETYDFAEETNTLIQELGFKPSSSLRTPLSTIVRFNASFQVKPSLLLSTDFVFSLRQNAIAAVTQTPSTFAGHISWTPEVTFLPKSNITLTSGVLYSDRFGARIPLGLSTRLGGAASFGIAVPDVLTYLGGTDEPYAGLSVATLGLDL